MWLGQRACHEAIADPSSSEIEVEFAAPSLGNDH